MVKIVVIEDAIEKKFLSIRGWKNWEEYDKIGERLETEINARKELIQIAIKITIKEIEKLIEELKLPEDKNYRYSNEYIEEWLDIFKQKIKELK